MKKLAIVCTHPVQYYAPLFQLIHARGTIAIHVFYTAWNKGNYDRGFQKDIQWDIPLIEGYDYTFVKNTAKDPGSHHFFGANNPSLIAQLREYGPDAILVYGWSYLSHLKTIRYFNGRIPLWFRGDSTLLDTKSGVKDLLRTVFLRWVYRNIDKAFYTGTANKAYFLKYGLPADRLFFAPHAIDNGRFGQDRTFEATAFRKCLKVEEQDILILFTGKFEPKKAPLLLIKAFIELQAPNVHLLMAGNGILMHEMELAKGNSTNIHIYPFVNQAEIPVYYQACDLFCLPSTGPGETWGLAVNEAMASGKAVLVSDKSGCAGDLVVPGKNGLIVNINQNGHLKEGLALLASDKQQLKRMGKLSVKIIQKYSFEAQAEIFEKQLVNDSLRR